MSPEITNGGEESSAEVALGGVLSRNARARVVAGEYQRLM